MKRDRLPFPQRIVALLEASSEPLAATEIFERMTVEDGDEGVWSVTSALSDLRGQGRVVVAGERDQESGKRGIRKIQLWTTPGRGAGGIALSKLERHIATAPAIATAPHEFPERGVSRGRTFFGIFSDGSFAIESDGTEVRLDREDFIAMKQFIASTERLAQGGDQ